MPITYICIYIYMYIYIYYVNTHYMIILHDNTRCICINTPQSTAGSPDTRLLRLKALVYTTTRWETNGLRLKIAINTLPFTHEKHVFFQNLPCFLLHVYPGSPVDFRRIFPSSNSRNPASFAPCPRPWNPTSLRPWCRWTCPAHQWYNGNSRLWAFGQLKQTYGAFIGIFMVFP